MKDFTTGKISIPLLAFAVPMLLGNLFQQLYNLVDAVVVGYFISGDALAAVGISMSMVILLTSMLIGFTTGAAVLVAQFFGAKQFDKLKRTVSVSIIFLAGLSLLLSLVGVILAPQLLWLFGTDDYIFDDALMYMQILMAGLVCMVFYNMYTAYMRALGETRRPLYILVLSVVLSGILSVYLVAVAGLGVFGAAVSTVFSMLLAAVLSYFYAKKKLPILMVEKLTFDKELFWLIIKYGAPAALQMSLVSFAHLLITWLINDSFGAPAMAAITAVARIDGLATMPVATLSLAVSTFVAQNMGARLEDRAIKGFKIATGYMLIASVVMTGVLMLLSSQVLSLFVAYDDPNYLEIIGIGQNYMNIMVIFYFLFAFLFAFNGFFRGVGDAVIAMVFPVLSLTLRTVSAYGLVLFAGMGPEALAWSIPIGWGIS
ncbi:MAG: MATE family efflux transporter, partial [Oscillospiraceae bacterium]|nr:MATE family efflux transporter [Oscillospiraceae bacterium]